MATISSSVCSALDQTWCPISGYNWVYRNQGGSSRNFEITGFETIYRYIDRSDGIA